jgi:hypothetical protein
VPIIKKEALSRFGWLVLIWGISVLALGVVAYALRWLIKH